MGECNNCGILLLFMLGGFYYQLKYLLRVLNKKNKIRKIKKGKIKNQTITPQ